METPHVDSSLRKEPTTKVPLDYASLGTSRPSRGPWILGIASILLIPFQVVWICLCAFWTLSARSGWFSQDNPYAGVEGHVITLWPTGAAFLLGCYSLKSAGMTRQGIPGGLAIVISSAFTLWLLLGK